MSIRQKVIAITLTGFVLGVLLIFVLGPVLFASIAYPLPEKYQASVAKWSQEYGIDPNLLCALIFTESGWHETSRSSTNAIGLTQFTHSTATAVAGRLGVKPFNPEDLISNPDLAIRFGAYYLADAINRYDGNVTKALISYNGGGGAVLAYERGAGIPGTIAYARKVQSIQDGYQKIYGSDWYKHPATDQNTGSTTFNVTPKADINLISSVPLLNFWRQFISSQVSNTTNTSDNGNLNSLWRIFVPSQ